MNFRTQESATKLRGGYYTPPLVAQFLTKWVLHKKPNRMLEPSCGDGAFIRALDQLHHHKIDFTGVEILEEESIKARQATQANTLLNAKIINTNFLKWALLKLYEGVEFDAVVGNPPFIRYQYLNENEQHLAGLIFSKYYLAFTKHTNAWVPFVIASIGLLAPSGRLAMVVPSELLYVLHAEPLRKFLLAQCHRILIIDPTELLFEQALQGTVLLMIEKKIDPSHNSVGVAIASTPNSNFLYQEPETFFEKATYVSGNVLQGKWMKILLTPTELNVFENLHQFYAIKRFKEIALVDVGIVTGANKFFLVNNAIIKQYELEEYARPMFGRSEHCPGVLYNQNVHQANQERGLPTNFLMFRKTARQALPEKVQEYLRLGEAQQLHTRYKCRIRSPWYVVPSVYSTAIGMLKRSHNYPRLILNSVEAYTTDTAYRIRPLNVGLSAEALVFCFVNSLTALTAELEGRHYGGGVLELVPSEIEKLLIPAPTTLNFDLEALDNKIKAGTDADELLADQDRLVLSAVNLTKQEQLILHEAWRRIRIRRHRLVTQAESSDDTNDD